MSTYCSAKAGLSMLTQVAALRVGSAASGQCGRPRVSCTPCSPRARHWCPGVVEEYVENTPLGRAEYSEDIAEAVVFLTKASWLTGEVLDLNGGIHMKRYPDRARARRSSPSSRLAQQ